MTIREDFKSGNNPPSFVVIHSWMLDLGLKGSELLAYALIFKFYQDGESEFKDSQQYVANWCGISRRNTVNTLSRLEDKGFIKKRVEVINKVKFCRYSVNLCFIPVSSRVKDANERV